MVLAQIFGAFTLASGTILERLVLRKKSIKAMQYQFLMFLVMILVMAPLLLFFGRVDGQALELKNILILLLVVGLSLVANYFTYHSMKGQKLSKLEPAKMMEPLFAIILTLAFSYLFISTYERNFLVIIPALIAGLSLILSHVEKKHLNFGKYFIYAMIGSFFFALELVTSKLILEYYSAISLYFVRCLLILIATWIIFRPKLKKGLDKSSSIKIILASLCWILLRIIIYTGYVSIGIVQTTLMIMLGPVLIYFFAWIFLKDKPNWKNLVASGVIILCIIYATFFQ